MNKYWKGFTRGVDAAIKIMSADGGKEERMEEDFDFVSEMRGLLESVGFEEDEFAEGSGRTFRDAFQTVYFERWNGQFNMYVSNCNHGNPWDDDKHFFFELPKEEEALRARGFQQFLLDVICALEEDSHAY